jgi:hypothetical protein
MWGSGARAKDDKIKSVAIKKWRTYESREGGTHTYQPAGLRHLEPDGFIDATMGA